MQNRQVFQIIQNSNEERTDNSFKDNISSEESYLYLEDSSMAQKKQNNWISRYRKSFDSIK